MKMHPIKNIAPLKTPKLPSFTDVALAYVLAISALLLAGGVTICYGFVLGWLTSITPMGYAISEGFMALGVPVSVAKMPQVGAALGFAAFCFTLPRVAKR